MIPTEKLCNRCNLVRPASEFRITNSRRYGPRLRSECRDCRTADERARRGPGKRPLRQCGACGERKAFVAFRTGSTTCMKCSEDRNRQPPAPYRILGRPTFTEWATYHRITSREMQCVRTALARYGMKGNPCPYDIIAEFCGPERYRPDAPPTRAAVLRHAVVLMANEARASTTNSQERAA